MSKHTQSAAVNRAKSLLLQGIVRNSMHEFNQSLTAFSFTSSTIEQLSNAPKSIRVSALMEDLKTMGSQMREAETRYRKTTEILDWLTVQADTIKRINLNELICTIIKLSESSFRKKNCRFELTPTTDALFVTSYISSLVYLFFSLMISLAETDEKVNRRPRKIKILTEYQPDVAVIQFHSSHLTTNFSLSDPFIHHLNSKLEVKKNKHGEIISLRLPLQHQLP